MGILGVISAQTMWIFKRLKRTKPGKARAETPTMVGRGMGKAQPRLTMER